MRLGQRTGLFVGVALVTGATIVLQIALTRLYSALLGHHLAFLAISLSLFGVGLGGVALYVAPGLARPPRLFARMAHLSCAMAASSVVAMVVLLRAKPVEKLDAAVLGQLAITYVVTSLPFVFGGVVVAAAIRQAARDISRLYLVDLVGAALGGLGAIGALRLGAPRVGLIVAVLTAAAATVFALAGRDERGPISPRERPPSAWPVAAVLLAAVALLGWDAASPWLRVRQLRWVRLDQVAFMRWNEMALITVDRPVDGIAWMRMDASAATAILQAGKQPPPHPDELGYVLHQGHGPALVIGAGGGRDILAALRAGQTEVYGAEINPLIVNEVMGDRYADWSGRLFQHPGVHVAVADGRSYVRSNDRRYRSIVISLVDTWAASSVGALSLSENSLYTVEAFRDFLQHLEPEGTLTVNRWDPELPRLVSLAAAGLRATGARHPLDHLYACRHTRSTALIVQATPYSPEQLQRLRSACRDRRFREVLAPDRADRSLARRVAEAASAGGPLPTARSDLSAPTDNRPFFFHTVPTRELPALLKDWSKLAARHQGLATLFGLLLASSATALLFLLGPLLLRRRPILGAADRWERLRALAFFLCLGAGYVCVELALVQQFVMFLGHPIYALSAVLVVLLLATGIGSLMTARFEGRAARAVAVRRALLLAAGLVGYALVLGRWLDGAVSLPFALRLALTVILLTPLGVLMGSQLPLGIKLVSSRTTDLIPWCWGLNGVASVVATASATLLAMQVGFSSLLVVAALIYSVGALVVPHGAAPDRPTNGSTPGLRTEPVSR